jgi:hypothetical protein
VDVEMATFIASIQGPDPNGQNRLALASFTEKQKPQIDSLPQPRTPVQKRKSRTLKRNHSYRKTPERLAASLANLEKARAAPKDLIHRPTVRRLLACRANLLKALRAKRERANIGPKLKRPRALRPVGSHVIGKVPQDDAQKNGG